MPGFSFEDSRFLVAPAVTSTGIVVSIFLWWLNQRRKALTYEIESMTPLVNYTGQTFGRLDVRFDGEHVENASLLVLRLTNSGHLPIQSNDFEAKLAVSLMGGASILTAEVIETHPANLQDRIKEGDKNLIESLEEQRIVMRPLLLNSGDAITLEILSNHPNVKIAVNGHVHGISAIKESQSSNLLSFFLMCLGGVLVFLSIVLVPVPSIWKLEMVELLPYILVTLIGVVVAISGWKLLQQWKTSRRMA